MKLNYVKRTCKLNRQELLNMALQEELEYLRKKIYPYKRHDLLIDNIQIHERRFYLEEDMADVAGLYKYNEKECIHNIYIDRSYIINTQKVPIAYYRRYHYRKLKQIIRHELIHAFVAEKWEHKCKYYIGDKHVDASPIFLSILYFVNGSTSHYCRQGFQKTKLYKFARYSADNYKELEEYLNNYLIKIIEQIQEIKEITNKDNFIKKIDKDYCSIQNNFLFAPRENGMYKSIEMSTEDTYIKNGQLQQYKVKFATWHIGCNIEPSRIIELYNKKQDMTAEYHSTKKQLIILPKNKNKDEKIDMEDCKFIKLLEEKNY